MRPFALKNTIKYHHDSMKKIITPNATLEIIADGFQWTEGPTWDASGNKLYFSDVLANISYEWSEQHGLEQFLNPSGLQSHNSSIREPGSNGMCMLDRQYILIANHGERRIEKVCLEDHSRTNIASHYNGRRLNSPNDLIISNNKTIYFTDPPYGLTGLNESPIKELPHNGLYQATLNGQISSIDNTLTFPNGVAFSPDQQELYVTVSDPERPVLIKYKKDQSERFVNKEIFFDMQPFLKKETPGLPDGLTIDRKGNIFVTGPGGIYILNKYGHLLGQIKIPNLTSNCTLGDQEKVLFITATDKVFKLTFNC